MVDERARKVLSLVQLRVAEQLDEAAGVARLDYAVSTGMVTIWLEDVLRVLEVSPLGEVRSGETVVVPASTGLMDTWRSVERWVRQELDRG